MKPETNTNGTRIAYEDPLNCNLKGAERELSEIAIREIEDTLATVSAIQERRKGSDGQIRHPLTSDSIKSLRDEIERLERSLVIVQNLVWRVEETDLCERDRATIACSLLESDESVCVSSEVSPHERF